MSLKGKKWIIKDESTLSTPIEKIVSNRGIFSEPELSDFLDPFLFDQMEKILEKIAKAIEENHKIIIFGDYDVDGITGTAILYKILSELGATVSYRIPNREKDGYGLSKKFVDEFIEKNINLVITVDCGISCFDEVKYAKEHNIEVIITDHHTIPERLPEDAYAILHPKTENSNYPYKELTGAGVAFKLAQALIRSNFEKEHWDEKENGLVDLASMGTISDLGPLTGENRLIVKKGLKIIPETKNFGLKKIIELSGIDVNQPIDTYTIGFKIGPRINAAGRIDSPYVALSLLLQDENSDRLHALGEKLEQLNKDRQNMMEKALKESKQKALSNEKIPFVIMDYSSDWHVGILGLVAGRLAEKYFRPAIMMQDFGDTLVASARSPEYFNIVEALTELKDLLISFGGHASAAGFNLKKENYDEFYKKMQEIAEAQMKDKDLRPSLEIDCALSTSDINFDLIEKISALEPFGVKNSKPVFLLRDVEARDLTQVGRENKHLRFSIQTPTATVETIAFDMGEYMEDLREHSKIDLVFHLDKSFWKNNTSIKLQALDIDFSKN